MKQLVRTNSSPWLQKPLYRSENNNSSDSAKKRNHEKYGSLESNTNHNEEEGKDGTEKLKRHLSLFDLTTVGIGGTVGSGIFVLCGFIANTYSGPATFLSWLIAGFAALLSGSCYAELSARIPCSGSAYVYVYMSIGELPAVIVAGCLTLEYVAAAAAVARSWGDKVCEWFVEDLGFSEENNLWLMLLTGRNPFFGEEDDNDSSTTSASERMFNPMAFVVSFWSVFLLLKGVKESKTVTTIFTILKVGIVIFMTVGGLILTKKENLSPLIPPQFGWVGVMRGATSSFFGYLGYDEICCIAGEAKNPKRNLPYAILLTLSSVMILYQLAALALVGMQPYTLIDGVGGFSSAFRYNDCVWAAQITAAGEILTLPVVVLITIMAQPRLQYALAVDGLLPYWFAKMDSSGNLVNGTWFSGVIMILVASFIPFTHLNDMISSGVLVAFVFTDTSLLLLRRESPLDKEGNDTYLVEKLVVAFNLFSFIFSMKVSHPYVLFGNITLDKFMTGFLFVGMIGSCLCMAIWCPETKIFGCEKRRRPSFSSSGSCEQDEDGFYKTPFLPFLPCLGIFVNWYLISQLEFIGVMLLVFFLVLCGIYYFMYGIKNSLLAEHYSKIEVYKSTPIATKPNNNDKNGSANSTEPLLFSVPSRDKVKPPPLKRTTSF